MFAKTNDPRKTKAVQMLAAVNDTSQPQAVNQHQSSTVNGTLIRVCTSSVDQLKAALWSTRQDTVRQFAS